MSNKNVRILDFCVRLTMGIAWIALAISSGLYLQNASKKDDAHVTAVFTKACQELQGNVLSDKCIHKDTKEEIGHVVLEKHTYTLNGVKFTEKSLLDG